MPEQLVRIPSGTFKPLSSVKVVRVLPADPGESMAAAEQHRKLPTTQAGQDGSVDLIFGEEVVGRFKASGLSPENHAVEIVRNLGTPLVTERMRAERYVALVTALMDEAVAVIDAEIESRVTRGEGQLLQLLAAGESMVKQHRKAVDANVAAVEERANARIAAIEERAAGFVRRVVLVACLVVLAAVVLALVA